MVLSVIILINTIYMTTHKGKYKIINPQKYKGNHLNIIYRSGWELQTMLFFDNHPEILWWSSEELFIPYISPVDNKPHRYFPDFIFSIRDKNGNNKIHMWEVKPRKQTVMPKRKTKRLNEEIKTYAINQEKWKAAELFCLEKGWKFSIITEDDLFGKNKG